MIAVILLNVFIRIFGCEATMEVMTLPVSNDLSGEWASPLGPRDRAALVHVARRHGPSAYDGGPRNGADEKGITGPLQIPTTDEEDRKLFNDILSMEAQSPGELVVNGILQHMAQLIFRKGRFTLANMFVNSIGGFLWSALQQRI